MSDSSNSDSEAGELFIAMSSALRPGPKLSYSGFVDELRASGFFELCVQLGPEAAARFGASSQGRSDLSRYLLEISYLVGSGPIDPDRYLGALAEFVSRQTARVSEAIAALDSAPIPVGLKRRGDSHEVAKILERHPDGRLTVTLANGTEVQYSSSAAAVADGWLDD